MAQCITWGDSSEVLEYVVLYISLQSAPNCFQSRWFCPVFIIYKDQIKGCFNVFIFDLTTFTSHVQWVLLLSSACGCFLRRGSGGRHSLVWFSCSNLNLSLTHTHTRTHINPIISLTSDSSVCVCVCVFRCVCVWLGAGRPGLEGTSGLRPGLWTVQPEQPVQLTLPDHAPVSLRRGQGAQRHAGVQGVPGSAGGAAGLAAVRLPLQERHEEGAAVSAELLEHPHGSDGG